jgi:adenosine deaminase
VVLHDHLDGGVRPETILEIARREKYELPADDSEKLEHWFVHALESGTLAEVLTSFEHTIAVMQTADDIARIAREQVLDLAFDGVVYAECRYAPELHLRGGLTPQQVVDAVAAGQAEGTVDAADAGHPIVARQLLCAMRQNDLWEAVAELATANRDNGVVGFDLAGPEDGFPPNRRPRAFEILREANLPYTIHAGEEAEPEGLWQAIQLSGATRVGHGALIKDDIVGFGGPDPALGTLADWVRDRQIHLEMCPTSNIKTRLTPDIASHPATELLRLGFNIGINPDDRLMMGTTASDEFARLGEQAGWSESDMELATLNALDAAFIHLDERNQILQSFILPQFL